MPAKGDLAVIVRDDNGKPVDATGTAFFDLTTPPEAASCRACSSYRQGSLDS
jgi:hypothetical protein